MRKKNPQHEQEPLKSPQAEESEPNVDRDEEDARKLREKAGGMPYADDPSPTFWQKSQQKDYLVKAYLASVQKEAPNALRNEEGKTQEAPEPEEATHSDAPREVSDEAAFEPGLQQEFDPAQSTAPDSEDTLEAIERAAPLTTGAKLRLFAERAAHFVRARRERREMGSVPDQQKEKKRQTRTLLIVCAAGILIVMGLVKIGETTRPSTKTVVQTYKSDFSVAPSGADKQAFQAAYEARVRVLEDRLRALQSELALVSGRLEKGAGKSAEAPNAPSVAVTDLPDLEESLAREAQTLTQAGSQVSAAAPRMAVVRVSDAREGTHKAAAPVRPVRRLVADSPIAANRARLEEENTYLPAGSFAQAVVLSGVTAATGGMAANNPVPLLMQVTDMAQLPNRFRANVKRCFLTGSATGDLSSERVWIRLDRLSCMRTNGKAIDVRVQGYATGEDGKTGVRARLVTRSGQAIANALFMGTLQGIGKAVSLSATSSVTYSSGATGTQIDNALRAGLGEGLQDATDRIVDYYMRLADKIFPVLELDSGRRVDVVLSQGVTVGLDKKEEDDVFALEGGNSARAFGMKERMARDGY